MASQQILFIVTPRSITLNADPLPVSVYVTPRLTGADRLEAFPDWLNWTTFLKEGFSLKFRCDGRELTRSINTQPLQPKLWKGLFKGDTFVRSHSFDDYSARAIHSYPIRYALSTIKKTYQIAGLELALPDRTPSIRGEKEQSPRRGRVRQLLSGFAVNWDEERGEQLRKRFASIPAGTMGAIFQHLNVADNLGADGLLNTMPPQDSELRQLMMQQFALFHHVPPGKPIEKDNVDFEHLIDFHQALSSLNSYPELLRALGLVLDFELPADFLRPSSGSIGKISVSDVPDAHWQLQDTRVPPKLPALETAYIMIENAAQQMRIFATAPGALGQLSNQIETLGLLNLAPTSYGIAQIDVDGAMHKTIMLAESWQDGKLHQAASDHPEVFDPTTTLPSIRSGGLSVFADARALKLLERFKQSKTFNDALIANGPQQRPFYAEDLIHGYRLDVWDSHTQAWHSLHVRDAEYRLGGEKFDTSKEEGFIELAATQASKDPANPPPDDLYLHEAVARWAGWSLSVPMPGKALSSDPDPDHALDDEKKNESATPFEMSTEFHVVKGTLPALRFGRRYRIRARVVDLCGNSLTVGDPITDLLSNFGFALPADPEGFAYLRYEPVAAPIVVVRDARAITDPGSSVDRLVIRTFNGDVTKDQAAADVAASDRHLVPPRTSVDTAEKLSMFDDASGKIVSSAAMYHLIEERDKNDLKQIKVEVQGQEQEFPLEKDEQIDPLPYLPDVLSRGIALRDLPGSADGTIGRVDAGGALTYAALNDPNPRPGSATIVEFGGADDWQEMLPLRLALAEADTTHIGPKWDGDARVLTVYLPKGTVSVVPLTSYLQPANLKLMGVWQWIREYIDAITVQQPNAGFLKVGADVDRVTHVLQRATEGGHWMITPPRLLTLVHAVQQPLGMPAFRSISVQHEPYGDPSEYPYDETRNPSASVLQTTPEKEPTAETELATITSWRAPRAVDAYLMGGLQVHGASAEKVDILAEWTDPIDDVTKLKPFTEAHSQHVDEVPIRTLQDGFVIVKEDTPNERAVAYYDRDHDVLCFVRKHDRLGNLLSPDTKFTTTITRDAAPRHYLNDCKHHRINYSAVATSRFREYFAPDVAGGFTRTSDSLLVDVPASARPSAPLIAYVVPTFGWQRQIETNLKRSVRFGGGLRVYLERPWYSSGEGELLGVSLYNLDNGAQIDRDKWKSYVTQWGSDPVWESQRLFLDVPSTWDFPDRIAIDEGVSLESPGPGRVTVVGYPVEFDEQRQLWYADLTINTDTLTYAPFIRLALVRYQPHAIPDAKISRPVLADFAQLTPTRAAVVTADPYHPRRLRVTVSGIAPSKPVPVITGPQPTSPITAPTIVTITVQQRRTDLTSDLGWEDVAAGVAVVTDQTASAKSDLIRWSGIIDFAAAAEPGRFRLVIREYEYISANWVVTEPARAGASPPRMNPGRLIYAETVELDHALIGAPSAATGTDVS
jgi:hypothetical protein